MLTVNQVWLAVITMAISFDVSIGCPIQCQCQETSQTLHVSCANQSLESIPANIPTTVTSLDLRGNHISNLANVFQSFTRLETLDLSFNRLMAFQSDVFQQNLRLEHLNLESNSLSVLEVNFFKNLPKLKTLNLANNSFTTVDAAKFQGLLLLEDLQLQGNAISTVSTDAFTNFNLILHLDLSENAIRELPENIFSNLQNLHDLNLQNNFLTSFDGFYLFGNNTGPRILDLSFNNIHNVTNLTNTNVTELDLSWNNITNISDIDLEHLENLSSLVLDGNPVSVIKTAVFEDLRNLHNLSISNMPKITYLSKSTFQGLNMLEVLNMSNNPYLSFIHKELFVPLESVNIIDLSGNIISYFHNETISANSQLSSLNLLGNNFTCDCAIEWLILNSQSNNSIILDSDQLECSLPDSGETVPLSNMDITLLYCSEVRIVNHSTDSAFKIGKPAILRCHAISEPMPEITWIMPHKQVLTYHNFHTYATNEYLNTDDQTLLADFKHVGESYLSASESKGQRLQLLADGSLYIEYVLRSDGGPYKCVARNPKNTTEVVINVTLDYSIINVVKIWSLVVGFSCAGGFFLLNLTYSLTLAAVRRCVSQRRRERIREILESMDQYKTAHLARIKENYNHQVGRIRDQYNYQLGRLREHHQNRMGRMREGASQKVEKMRDNYNNQLGRLKDYSSNQLLQLREKYNSQVDKMKDYGGDKLDKIHEKYKLKQQHVIKLIEVMNLDNCRTVFESECVRTESMILHSDMFPPDVNLHTPSGSVSPSDSEYVTASSSESSKYSSQENIHLQAGTEIEAINDDRLTPMNPYIPDGDDESDENNYDKILHKDNLHTETDAVLSLHPETKESKQYKGRRRQRKKRDDYKFSETEIFYNNDCDTQFESNLAKENDTNEAKEQAEKGNKLNDSVWYTNANSENGACANISLQYGSSHSLSQLSYPSTSGLSRPSRSSKKQSKGSKSNGKSSKVSKDKTDDVTVDMSEKLYDWTLKETVV